MTRIFLATPENISREVPTMVGRTTKNLLFALMMMRSMAHASTVMALDFPIFIFDFREEDAVRIITHEENHRALLSMGEWDASRALDHPFAVKRVDGWEIGAKYRAIHNLYRGLSASPKTEAR